MRWAVCLGLLLWALGPVLAQTETLTGLDRLAAENFTRLSGKRVGFVLNQTSRDRFGRHLTELLPKEPDFEIKRLFTPEHGLLGVRDEKIEDGFHSELKLPIKSLYGETREPRLEWLRDIDLLVFDLQDVGVRYYTYISTLQACLKVAAQTGTEVLVLDRPNPLGGTIVDGHRATHFSFIACDSLPIVHGLTIGEVGNYLNREIGADYDVMRMKNWNRSMTWSQTRLPLFSPSPNLAVLEAIELYPVLGLLEWCELSVGRGTRSPFRVIGAPYISDPSALAGSLNEEFAGQLTFLPRFFIPASSVYQGDLCGGVEISLEQPLQQPSQVGCRLAAFLERRYPDSFHREKMARHLGTNDPFQFLETPPQLGGWTEERKRYTLYDE